MEAASDFTMWALFARATLIVKFVMIMLVLASVWCWAVIVDKWIQYRKARAEAAVFDRVMRCLTRSERSPRASRKRYSHPACWNGGAVTDRTAG